MGNGYNHHHFQYQQNLHNLHRTTFLPMLCSRTSTKDVVLPRLEDRSTSFSNDPLSPKIGCMGQVKRNNKIIGFPTTSHNNSNRLALTTKSSSSSNDAKYFKLKRLFSAKNITVNNSNNNNNNDSTSCTVSSGSRRRREVTTETEVSINIAEMDPPLPVIKREPKPAGDHLWKRRSNGGALKSLELKHIQIPRHQVEIQTV